MARTSRPYSSSYSSSMTRDGSLPFLRTGTKPAPSCCASAPPKMKPRDSTPTTTSTLPRPCRAARCSITAVQAGPSLSSVVMSLKRMPSVGKSLMSRIFALRAATSMTGVDLTRDIQMTQHKPRSAIEEAIDELAEIGDHEIGMGGAGRARGREVDPAHPDALGALNVGDRVVAHMRGVARLGGEGGEGAAEYLGVGLAVADLVGVGNGGEVTQEIVACENLPQDDAGRAARVRHDPEGDPARGEGPHGFVRPRAQGGRESQHGLDVAGKRILEVRGGHRLADARGNDLEDEPHLLLDARIAVLAPEALGEHALRAIVGLHDERFLELAAGSTDGLVEGLDAEPPLGAQVLRRILHERLPEIEGHRLDHGPTRTSAGASRERRGPPRGARPWRSSGRRR